MADTKLNFILKLFPIASGIGSEELKEYGTSKAAYHLEKGLCHVPLPQHSRAITLEIKGEAKSTTISLIHQTQQFATTNY